MESMILIVLCLVICCGITCYSWQNSKKNIADSGAQHVVTVGVLFTFLGIAYSLYHFETNAADMVGSINKFLDGMKLAFVTSIIGMVSGLLIKFFQRNVEQSESDSVKENFTAVNEINNATKINTELLKNILKELRESDNSELSRELRKFVAAMENFVPDMRNLSESMNAQSKMLEQLSTTLAKSIETFGETQAARLDAMKISIEKMQASTAQAEKNSAELLSETKNYQRQSLENDERQLKILSDNTAQIVDMKISFDKFLKDMSKNFSENFIAALNESIKNLNNQLQNQFGENFKELNAAVREVAVWQREYKNIVTKTTEELKIINETFNRKVMSELQTALKTFADTSEKNISVQKNLASTVEKLAKISAQADESISQMQNAMKNFGKFGDDALKNLKQVTENFSAEIKKINSLSLGVARDTEEYLKNFNKASADSMKVIRDTIARYKTELDEETKSSLGKLHQLFETVAKNTDAQSGKAIKSLAVALAEINEKMIGNYKALVAKIAEVDELLRRRAR